MCNLFSGHTVFQKGKDWGKVIIVTAQHHEEDRKDSVFKAYGGEVLAWETINTADIDSGVKLCHTCGKDLSAKETEAIIELTNNELKKIGFDRLIRIAGKHGSLDLNGTQIDVLPGKWGIRLHVYYDVSKSIHLPDYLTVNGDLNISMLNIESPPRNLTVRGDLYLSDAQIKLFGITGTVDRTLSFVQKRQLPDSLTVGGEVYV